MNISNLNNEELITWYNEVVGALIDMNYNKALKQLFTNYELKRVICELIKYREEEECKK